MELSNDELFLQAQTIMGRRIEDSSKKLYADKLKVFVKWLKDNHPRFVNDNDQISYKNMKSKPAVEVPETTENQKGTIDTTKELSKGSIGEEVKRLQTALNGLLVDGNFGALTEARLKVVTGKTSISLRGYNDYMANKTAKK